MIAEIRLSDADASRRVSIRSSWQNLNQKASKHAESRYTLMSNTLKGRYGLMYSPNGKLSTFLAGSMACCAACLVAMLWSLPENRPHTWGRLLSVLISDTRSTVWLFVAGILGYGGFLAGKAAVDITLTSLEIRPAVSLRMVERLDLNNSRTSTRNDAAAAPPESRPIFILDVGCETGLNATRIRQRFGPDVRITCVDGNPSETTIRRNLELESLPVGDLRVEAIDFSYLPFEADSFDVVLNTMGLAAAADGIEDERRASEARKGLLSELVRVCKAGGTIVSWDIADPALFGTVRLADLTVSEGITAFAGLKTRIVSGVKVGNG